MIQANVLKGMRSTGDFLTMWYDAENMDQQGAVLAHQTVSHIYPEGELQVEFVEKTDAYWLIAELPDIQRDDITIRVEGDMLSIHGEWPEATSDSGSVQVDRPRQAFARQFKLEEPVEADHISVTYADGELAVCVPKMVSATAESPAQMLVESA